MGKGERKNELHPCTLKRPHAHTPVYNGVSVRFSSNWGGPGRSEFKGIEIILGSCRPLLLFPKARNSHRAGVKG